MKNDSSQDDQDPHDDRADAVNQPGQNQRNPAAPMLSDDQIDRVVGSLRRFLSVRDRCAKEVERKLQSQGQASGSTIAQVIDRLVATGLVDDRRMARDRISYRIASDYGPHYIINDLYRLGIDRSLVQALLATVDPDEFIQAAGRALARIIPELQRKQKGEAAIYSRLQSRGFSQDQIDRALGQLRRGDPARE